MVANGINGKRDHDETFLISHTNTLFNEQIKVKLPVCFSSRILNRRTQEKAHPGYRLKILQHSFKLVWNVRGVK